MNVIYPLKKQFSDLIFNQTKPFEFRNHIPKDLHIGDKIFVYETKTTGSGKVIGYFTVGDIQKIDYQKSKIGTYFFMDTYAAMYCSKEVKDMIDKAKQIHIPNYYDSIVLDSLFNDEELDFMLIHKKLPEHNYFSTFEELKKYEELKQKRMDFCWDCDAWLEKIGFYNAAEESTWKYFYRIDNPCLFPEPIPISSFLSKENNYIKAAPQSFCYTLTNEI